MKNHVMKTDHLLLFFPIDLKQELQVRQKAIHETPDNEKHEKTAVVDENEKSDPTKSPLAYPSSNNNNKLPSSAPLKRKTTCFFTLSSVKKLALSSFQTDEGGVSCSIVPVTTTTDTGITQAARHSALNIVGDLLRRVGVCY